MIYESEHLYFLRKPAGVPTTRGPQASFLDALEEEDHHVLDVHHYHDARGAELHRYTQEHLKKIGASPSSDIHGIAQTLLHTFSDTQEYGLLNRLDTPTSGFLYFAKDQEIYNSYKIQQSNGVITKHYLAAVHGNPGYMFTHGTREHGIILDETHFHISYPIMHHLHLDDRMHVVKEKFLVTASGKGRGKSHDVTTSATILRFHEESNITYLHVSLNRGIRHQIRAHLGSIGYPIVGDVLYARKTHHPLLHLRSIGCEITHEAGLMTY